MHALKMAWHLEADALLQLWAAACQRVWQLLQCPVLHPVGMLSKACYHKLTLRPMLSETPVC